MSDELGRDRLWNPETWGDIDKAVMAEVGRQRVAQKVFEAQPIANVASVSADVLVADQNAMTIQEGIMLPLMEISAEFALTKGQVENEGALHNGRTLACLAARSVARAEDLLFFRGAAVSQPGPNNAQPLINPARATNPASAGNGLLQLLGIPHHDVIPNPQPGAGYTWGPATFDTVAGAITEMVDRGEPGPYALFLAPNVHADALVTVGNSTTTADRIVPLVEGRLYASGALPPNQGLLVSLGGNPTTIHVAKDAVTAYTQEDQQGVHRFRVFERVQLVAREAAALERLDFLPPQAGGAQQQPAAPPQAPEAQPPQGPGRGPGRNNP